MTAARRDVQARDSRRLEADGPPANVGARRIGFGDVVVEFTSGNGTWLGELSRRYEGFDTETSPSFSVRYNVVDSAPAASGPSLDELRATEAPHAGRLELMGPGFEVSIDFAAASAVITGPRHTYPVDSLMRELLPMLVTDGVVMHAALVRDGGRASVCAGPPGCGKTTLAALLGERALCDELALVRVRRGAIEACSLPFWNARPGCAPLAGIYLLRHGKLQRRTRLSPEDATRPLFAQVLWPARFPDALARTLAIFGVIVERVPAWDLEFAPTPDVASVLFSEDRS